MTDSPAPESVKLPIADWPLLGVAAALLVYGGFYAAQTYPPPTEVTTLDGQVSLVLPSGWVGEEREGYYEASVSREALFSTVPTLRITPLEPEVEPEAAPAERVEEEWIGRIAAANEALSFDLRVTQMDAERRAQGHGYRIIDASDDDNYGGVRAAANHFAMVQDPPGTVAGVAVIPEVVVGLDILVDLGESRLYHVSLTSPPDRWTESQRVLEQLDFSGEGSP